MLPSRKFVLLLCFELATAAMGRHAFSDELTSSTIEEAPITSSDREHWAFQPLKRPPLPTVRESAWARNAIDAFVLEKLEQKQLHPQPEADRLTLIRRVTFDLTGLPPSPAEIDAFVNDAAPDAYERLVERLLDSPRFGPRWGQFWLDLARFAETDGYEFDKPRQNAWRYRDWVIDAANRNLRYDEFIRLQIAGDELEPNHPDALVATAFCLSGPDMPDINSQEERRHTLLNEMTGTVASVVLGLQLGCAQCHDHKFDPVSQADFYRFRAFFQPAVHVEKNKSIDVLQVSEALEESHIFSRGDWRRPGPIVTAAFPRIALTDVAAGTTGSLASPPHGLRAELAKWVTTPDHPLTARVIANRVWQFHFGRGICETPSDLGLAGDWPTHPELLDWLAAELVAQHYGPEGFTSADGDIRHLSTGESKKSRERDRRELVGSHEGRPTESFVLAIPT